MRLTLVGNGTRGDVQPYVCVGAELQAMGHDVTVVAPLNMQGFVERAGLRCAAMPFDIQALLSSRPAEEMLARGDMRSFFSWLQEQTKEHGAAILEVLTGACANADAILGHPLGDEALAMLAEERKVPLIPFYLYPIPPSSEFPNLFVGRDSLGPLNRFSHWALRRLMWRSSQRTLQEERRKRGLQPARGPYLEQAMERRLPILLAYSSLLFPRPSDWGDHIISAPNVALSEALKARLGEVGLSPELEAWLDAGPPPVFIGFGSMPILEPEKAVQSARRALESLGLRGILSAGWSRMATQQDDRLIMVGPVDHAAVFQRCAAVLHHGGAGTTYASLRSGRPTVIASVFADQPFWARRIERLGVGAGIRFQDLNESTLISALRRALKPEVITKAAELGARLRQEEGAAEVARHVARLAETTPPPGPQGRGLTPSQNLRSPS